MLLKGYDITLQRVRDCDIEMIRNWRNSVVVNQFMEFREYISKEQQQVWFKEINTIYNNYFLIIDRDKPIGLIYGAQIDWQKGVTGNGGIFMSEEKHFLTDIPLRAMFLINDMGYFLGLKESYIKVLSDNQRAIFFNKKMGYELLPNQENELNQKYVLTIENYLINAQKFKKILGYKDNIIIELIANTQSDYIDLHFLEQLNKHKNNSIPGVQLKVING